MIWSIFFLGCAAWGIWHFARATYRAFKYRYVMWSYSWGSEGSRVYEADDPGRFRIGSWTNIIGLALMTISAAVIANDMR